MKLTRRRFIFGGLSLAGALIVGWGLMPMRQRLTTSKPIPVVDGTIALNGWVQIANNGVVTMFLSKCEMGQGVSTALPMLLAEELDVPLSSITVVPAGNDKIYGNVSVIVDGLPFRSDDNGWLSDSAKWITGKVARELGLQLTAGSSSIKDSWLVLRQAGASARAMLIAAAAQQWNVAPATCRTKDGIVFSSDGRQLSYGELAALAVHIQPENIQLKNPSQFTLIGQSQPRLDSLEKSNGQAKFGIDVRLPDMLYAAIRMSPKLGGKLVSMNDADLPYLPGVIRVLNLEDLNTGVESTAGVVVVAKSYWQARTGLAALQTEWEGLSSVSDASVYDELRHKLNTESGYTYFSKGDITDQKSHPAQVMKAEYSAPYLAHAAMEPVNCTAQVVNGKVKIWVGTQSPSIAIKVAAKVAQVHSDHVELHQQLLGGAFGRRLDVDMVAQAVAVAMHTHGVPVQLIWSREEDIAHDFYRPAAVARFNASLDSTGQVMSYESKSASDSIIRQVMHRNYGLPIFVPDKSTVQGEFDLPYEFHTQRIAHVVVPGEVPIGYWRSVGHSHNAFFTESFIDELAHAAKKSPVEFRQNLLRHHPRHLAVLNAAAAMAGGPLPEGHAHGIALHQSFGSIVAQIAEVSLRENEIVVHKVSCAVDCGIVVNPNIVRQQVESAVVFGLSAALFGEITFKAGKVEQSNFNDYQVLRMNQAPQVDVTIITSSEPPTGMGEPATPPIAPAVANALFNLTGQRLRQLPLRLG